MLRNYSCLALALTLGTTVSQADTTATAEADSTPKSVFDQIWGLPVLYKNDTNRFVEEIDFTGRFQLDYFNVESTHGNNDFVEVRRFRLGMDSWFVNRHLEFKGTVDTALLTYHAPSVFYNRFTDLFLKYHASDAFNLRAGKFEPHFGYDREFSDIQQKFFERGIMDDQVFNNTGNDYATGASILGKVGNWGYQVTSFSDNVDRELGQFNGGHSELYELSYDFSKALKSDKALLAGDYMHMENGVHANVFNTLNNAAAAYFDYQLGRYGLVGQAGYGNGIPSKGELYAFMLMPSYYLVRDRLEALVRLQYATSDKPNGIALMDRQDKTIGAYTGNDYESAYFGLNFYIYGQKCKFMLGEQLDNLHGGTGAHANFRGWTTLAGFRMYW